MISVELYELCQNVFLKCDYFANNDAQGLRNLCRPIDGLKHLALKIPNSVDSIILVQSVLAIVLEGENDTDSWIFPKFIKILQLSISEGDARRIEFDDLLSKVQEYRNFTRAKQPKIHIDKHEIFNSIIEIDFKDQEDNIIQAIRCQEKRQRKAAFLVNGYDDRYGQEILIERLFRKLPEFINGRKIKIKLDSGCEISYFWKQIAPEFFGSEHIPKMTKDIEEKIIDKIRECLQSQNLIFIFYIPDYLLAGFLTDLIQHFWQPVVDRVNHKDTYLTMFLVEHNHKELGAKGLGACLASDFEDEPSYPSYPLYLSQLSKFSSKHLNEWLDNGVKDEKIRQNLLAGMQQRNFVDKLLKETEWGIPELVYKKICRYFDVSWEEIDQCQIR
ncbi:hypothetical protein H6G80_23760 [Nostoc sp. FACHB-87]|uniref:hypothetical protein n=1 Tax=Nostocaceae TaxID=1162 RepID=UPI00168415F1|nr:MULTISPECIES: hypothetical protein [Nostocaceae]MBD2457078.1 hypothetical protein [Nostoc sp. FACHB-87]MBD2478264.1 hypothetical protein [Anabaena sp. FACHB-83]